MVLCCTDGEHANGQGEAIRTSHGLHALSCTGRSVYIWEMWGKNHSTNLILSMSVYQHACVVHIGAHIQMYMTIHTVYIRKTILDTLKMLSLDSTSH